MPRSQFYVFLILSATAASGCQRKQEPQVEVQTRKPESTPFTPTEPGGPDTVLDSSDPFAPGTTSSNSPAPIITNTPPVSPITNSVPTPVGIAQPVPISSAPGNTTPGNSTPGNSTPDASQPESISPATNNAESAGTSPAADSGIISNTPDSTDQPPAAGDASTVTTTDSAAAFITIKMSDAEGVTLSFAKDVEKASYRISSQSLTAPIAIDAGVAKVLLAPVVELQFSLKESASKICKAQVPLNSAQVLVKLEAIKCQ